MHVQDEAMYEVAKNSTKSRHFRRGAGGVVDALKHHMSSGHLRPSNLSTTVAVSFALERRAAEGFKSFASPTGAKSVSSFSE